MNIEQENEAKKFYLESKTEGIHFQETNEIRINYLDMLKLMVEFAKHNVNKINENNLLDIGFEKNYEHLENGFYKLDVNDKFDFTVDFKTMTLSIRLKGYGHIQKLEHIKTIKQITDLFFALTGKTLLITHKTPTPLG
jgi:hypothetical protein